MGTETTKTEVTEFEDGSKIVTTETVTSEYVDGEGEPVELEVAEPVEVIEEVTDAAVEIAEIEAERDVAIAEINAEVATAAIEASEDNDEWRASIEAGQMRLAEELGEQRAMLQLIQQQLTPPEPNPQSQSVEENSAPTQESPVVEEVAPEPPKRPKRSRWI